MNKLSANGYKGIKFLTSLIEIKHMIIYSPSLASLHRASPLAAAQYMRSVIGPRDSRRQIGALPRPILSGAGGDAEAALAS